MEIQMLQNRSNKCVVTCKWIEKWSELLTFGEEKKLKFVSVIYIPREIVNNHLNMFLNQHKDHQ